MKDSWPKLYKCRFIEPGLVNYSDYGMVLVQKPALDKMAQTFVGKPVVNVVHKDVVPADFNEGNVDGIVSKVWFNDADGWYWAEFLVWDPATQRNCESSAYSVSCAYNVKDHQSAGGHHNNIPFDQEILLGEYTHLAVVANPRYEGARIIYNSKGGKDMKLKFWKSDKDKADVKNASEMEMQGTTIEVDGKEVPFEDMVTAYNSMNAAKPAPKLGDDAIVEIDGKQVSVKDLKNSYAAKLKNDDDADEKKKKKDKEDEEKKNAEDAEKKKKDEEEKKNAAEGKKSFDQLKNAESLRGTPQLPVIMDRREKAKVGAERYGSAVAK